MTGRKRLIAYVGSYKKGGNTDGGGIFVVHVSLDGRQLVQLSRVMTPKDAGYLVYARTTNHLYAVDERRTDGRGPVEPPSQLHAFSVDPRNAGLTWVNSRSAPGPNPSFIAIDETQRLLVTANHGGFDHVERVVQSAAGEWVTEFVYDDSTVVLYSLDADGRLGAIRDVWVLQGHGKDPNRFAQAGGHAQASAHAHCAVFDPSGRYVLVCDKSTDRILVFEFGRRLQLASTFCFPEETAPRHIAFDSVSGLGFVTCELSSELASFRFLSTTGELRLLDKQSTLAPDFHGRNEPAEVRVHPNGRFVYVNNRGEDSLVWFAIGAGGELVRRGEVMVAKSVHPGLAARSFAFAPSGAFLLFADRSANLLRSFAVRDADGGLEALTEFPMPDPAFIVFAEFAGAPSSDSVV